MTKGSTKAVGAPRRIKARPGAITTPARKPATSRSPRKGTEPVASPESDAGPHPASELIDQRIRELADWRGATLAQVRALILEADPAITEEWKWGVPVWSHDGIVCTGESYKRAVKLTFARGASIADPGRLFNSSLEGNTRRAIDLREGDKIDASAFRALIRRAVEQNGATVKPGQRPDKRAAKRAAAPGKRAQEAVTVLAGGNPQIAKGEGNAPVEAWIAALPGWKRELAERLDTLIVTSVPGVRKAMKWNSPLYGVEANGWFLGLHAFTHDLKVAFFRGASLRPLPPGKSKDPQTRYVDLREGEFDERQMGRWVRQAAALPGWVPGRKA